MKTLRQLLTEDCIREGYDTTNADLLESLRESFTTVWEGEDDEHRWRIDYNIVCCIDDGGKARYFKYSACKGTNDNSWDDAGYCFEGIDQVVEVFAKEVTSISYVTEDKL